MATTPERQRSRGTCTNNRPGGNPGANGWFLDSTPIQMPARRGGICARLTQDLPSTRLQGGCSAAPRRSETAVGPTVALCLGTLVVLGGWVFLLSEEPLYLRTRTRQVPMLLPIHNRRNAVGRSRHRQDSQGQILALACRSKLVKT